MISWDHIADMMEKSDLNAFRIMQGKRKIHEYKCEGTSCGDAVSELEGIRGWFEGMPNLRIEAAKDGAVKAHWQNAHVWPLEGPPANATGMNRGMGMGAMNPLQMLTMMMGMNEKVMNAKLEGQQKEFDFYTRMADLENKLASKDNSIIPEKYDKFVDLFIMRQMKMEPKELVALAQMYGPQAQAPAALAGQPVEVETEAPAAQPAAVGQFTDQQVDEIQNVVEGIEKTVPFDTFIRLLKAVEKDPTLADKAVLLLNP